MIIVKFQIINGERPHIAEQIEASINKVLQIDSEVDNTVTATILMQYEGDNSLKLNISINVPIRTNTRIIEIAFEEMKGLVTS